MDRRRCSLEAASQTQKVILLPHFWQRLTPPSTAQIEDLNFFGAPRKAGTLMLNGVVDDLSLTMVIVAAVAGL